MIEFIIIYSLIINLFSFYLMGKDKKSAKEGGWRVSEMKFMILAVLGGSIGIMVGMYAFSHKTKKKKFTVGVPVILIMQTIAGIAAVVYSNM